MGEYNFTELKPYAIEVYFGENASRDAFSMTFKEPEATAHTSDFTGYVHSVRPLQEFVQENTDNIAKNAEARHWRPRTFNAPSLV